MTQKILLIIFASLFAMSQAMAEVKFNGFASIVTGIDLEDDGNPTKDYGSRTADNLQESKVALQWSADLGDGMRFVGQTMARGDSAEGFVLAYDWAYFDFNIGDSSKLKVGRLRIPFYKYSDYLDVGYAYHWITPPKSMYSLAFSNMDGISFQQNLQLMNIDNSITLALGTYQGLLSLGLEEIESKLENLLAINWSATAGSHEFTAAIARADVYFPSEGVEGLSAVATAGGDDANKVLINGDEGFFIGIGYKGTFGDISVFSEYNVVQVSDSIVADSSGGYLGVSYLMGDYTYHITYGITKDEEKEYAAATDAIDLGAAAVLAAGGTPTAADLSGSTLNSTARYLGNGDSNTITIGVRKDIGTSTALKVDLDLYTEDKVQDDQIASVSEERKATILKFAIETMF